MASSITTKVVVALAGRRIDAIGAIDIRFPVNRIDQVCADIKSLFEQISADLLICSAACGADLIALEVAKKCGIRYLIVLPFSAERFRQSSVVDRPGNWGVIFDQIMQDVSDKELIVLQDVVSDDEAYELANKEIIRQAVMAAAPDPALAIAVWDEQPRREGDATASFLQLAISAGMKIKTVSTC